MPCHSDHTYSEGYRASQAELDCVTALLCEVCQYLEIEHHVLLSVPLSSLAVWWQRHKEADRKRQLSHQDQQRKTEKKRRALAKLSVAEVERWRQGKRLLEIDDL